MAEFAPLYERLAARNVPPHDAKELEVWEAAAVLGVVSGGEEEASPPSPTGDVARLLAGVAAESPAITDPDRVAELRAAVGQVHKG